MPFTEDIRAAYSDASKPYVSRIPALKSEVPRISIPPDHPDRFTVEYGPVTPWVFQNYDLWPEQAISSDGGIDIDPSLQGVGLGGSLQRAKEIVCMRLGIHTIVINRCDNTEFWSHMGFQHASSKERDYFEYLDLRLAREVMVKRL